jgi:hypothetical protein
LVPVIEAAAQVEHERVGVPQDPHGGGQLLADQFRGEQHRLDLQQPDVAGQPLDAADAAHGLPDPALVGLYRQHGG